MRTYEWRVYTDDEPWLGVFESQEFESLEALASGLAELPLPVDKRALVVLATAASKTVEPDGQDRARDDGWESELVRVDGLRLLDPDEVAGVVAAAQRAGVDRELRIEDLHLDGLLHVERFAGTPG